MIRFMRHSGLASMVAIAVVSGACSRQAPKDEPSPSPVAAAKDAPGACAGIRARFNAEYARRTDTCKTEADCSCYSPVGGKQLGCGGVTDAATATRLEAIQADFHAASCDFEINCAPWACAPRCESGRCTR